ncbi:MAG TPA: aminotransferase class I/II-fold pyridoxal phosphate-dependent enzyme [Thermoanaerobaculia bacterium]|jgi:glutamate/tyrosine decarboxylase-like PLP-dependent enzyme|nr:aminotransferase class I/II-fold pyridoxal phosphate-dependent enzyme [Thermoanaerobaculia bacterium]
MSDFDLSPEELRRLGALVVDAVAGHRERLLSRPVFGKVGPDAALFRQPLPEDGRPFEDVLAFVREHVLPYPMGNSHPRFYGFINATADPVGVFADFIAATMNPNCWGGDHAATHVEARVVAWLAEMVGYPESADGVLVSGGSMANFTAIATARRATTPGNVREDGLAGPGRPRLVVYCSDQTHSCVDKAVDLLGIGTKQLRKIETDERFHIVVPALRAAIAADRAAGLMPAILVGNAGTVNTGAIDPLDELAEIARAERLWFHVDGAYGGLASMVPEVKPLFAGMEKADSIAVDPHKWLYVPYEAGATLVREPGRMAATFRKFPEYLASDPESPFPGPAWFAERGVELSRGFKALKVWMGIQTHGRRAYAERIASDIALARFLSDEVDRRPDFERLAEPVLSIANFRYRPAGRGLSDEALDALNRRIINRLVADGAFFLAPTVLKGRTALRVSITNFRTKESDLLALLDEAARVGKALAAS